jgi:hypothetical protein
MTGTPFIEQKAAKKTKGVADPGFLCDLLSDEFIKSDDTARSSSQATNKIS